MANPVNSTLLRLYLDGTVIASATDCEMTRNKDTPDITSKDSGANAAFMSGVKDTTFSMSVFYAEGEMDAVHAAFEAADEATLKYSTEVSGEEYWEQEIHINSYTVSSPGHNQPCTGTISFRGTGAVTKSDNA